MKRKEIYKMINEEVSEFDFLGITGVNNELAHNKILKSKEFQTNLIKDVVTDISNKNKFSDISTTFVNKETDINNDTETIELEMELTYHHNEEQYNLILFMDGNVDDESINYNGFNIKFFSNAGDQIKMEWIEQNKELYKRLIESLIKPFFA